MAYDIKNKEEKGPENLEEDDEKGRMSIYFRPVPSLVNIIWLLLVAVIRQEIYDDDATGSIHHTIYYSF